MTLQDAVLRESSEHGDMIISVMTDSYRNMTLKILAGMEWSQKYVYILFKGYFIYFNVEFNRYCPSAKHVLKADDDVFVQLPRLAHFLKEMSRRQPAIGGAIGKQVNPIILGFVASGWHPGRLVGHKYYISPRQFPGDVLPDFVTGPSYVASSTAIQ